MKFRARRRDESRSIGEVVGRRPIHVLSDLVNEICDFYIESIDLLTRGEAAKRDLEKLREKYSKISNLLAELEKTLKTR
ncbi:MAG: hypothetical protein GXO26_09010 [Crenarchaeota archaeon]|nr:hypothetical protein [Thermoproteota archaeon]